MGKKLGLQSRPKAAQEDLAREMGAIRLVDRDTLNAVAEEFTGRLSAVGLSALGGAAAALHALADHISSDLARRLRAGLIDTSILDDWAQIKALPADIHVTILTRESVQIGAVLLSKLPVTQAATLLGRLPGPQARRITNAVNQTTDILPDAVKRIGAGLCAEYSTTRQTAFERPPVDRLGAVLNSSPTQTREDMLSGLAADDAVFARDERKAIFTFADIPARFTPTDVPMPCAPCLRMICRPRWPLALATLANWRTGGCGRIHPSQYLATDDRTDARNSRGIGHDQSPRGGRPL